MVKKRFSLFDIIIYAIISLFAAATVFPFINVIAISISDLSVSLSNPLVLIPRKLDFSSYKVLFENPLLLACYRNTVVITVVGTFFSMLLTITTAFPLSRGKFMMRPFFVYVIVFTMLFNGGLIPNFYLVSSLGMYDTLWALIVPGSLSAFNIILLINFFKSIPESLLEAAKIDGASDFQVLVLIMLPLSLAILATLTLFYAVGRWNSFFNAVIYIRDRNKWTLQLFLREILIAISSPFRRPDETQNYIPPQSVRYASIIVVVIPILTVYPFLQKYFIKGVMLGSVKE